MKDKEITKVEMERQVEYDERMRKFEEEIVRNTIHGTTLEITNDGTGIIINLAVADETKESFKHYGNKNMLIENLQKLLSGEQVFFTISTYSFWNNNDSYFIENIPCCKRYKLTGKDMEKLLNAVQSVQTLHNIDIYTLKRLMNSLNLRMTTDEKKIIPNACYLYEDNSITCYSGYCRCGDRGFSHEQNKVLNALKTLMKTDIAVVNYLLEYVPDNYGTTTEEELLNMYNLALEVFTCTEDDYDDDEQWKEHLPKVNTAEVAVDWSIDDIEF